MALDYAVAISAETKRFYSRVLRRLIAGDTPFLVAGAFALGHYTGIQRDTKDLDVFCTAGDFPILLKNLEGAGYQVEITDANWLAKAFDGDRFIDVIFASRNGIWRVDEGWLERSQEAEVIGVKVRVPSATDLLFSKLYIQDRPRFDGADVNHIILKQAGAIDWHALLGWMDLDWELLMAALLNFRWVYPSDRELVPSWLLDSLLARVQSGRELPASHDRVCRGPQLSSDQYLIDIREWGYKER